MQKQSKQEYLLQKYREDNLEKYQGLWNPFINPLYGYIPECSVCKSVYKKFKEKRDSKVKMPHPPQCMWFEFYVSRMKLVLPQVNIEVEKNITSL